LELRIFQEYFQQSASEWRKNKLQNSKIVQENCVPINYNNCIINIGGQFDMQNIFVDIKDIPDMYAVYIRHIGSYKGNEDLYYNLFAKLFNWAKTHNLFTKNTKVLSLYNDFPEITEDNKLKLMACITIDKKITPSPPFGKIKINGGKYAICRLEISKNDFEISWDFLYGNWLPRSGYLPDDKPSFELFYNDPKDHPEHKHIVDLCIPVKSLEPGAGHE